MSSTRYLAFVFLTGCVAETFDLDVGPAPSLWMLRFTGDATDIYAASPRGTRRVVTSLEEPERVSSHSAGLLNGSQDLVVTISSRDLGATELVHLDPKGVVRRARHQDLGELGDLSPDGLLPVCCKNGLELLRVDGSVEASFPDVVLDQPIERPERLEYRWSRDGRRVSIDADVDGERTLLLVDLDGRVQRFPVECTTGFTNRGFSSDGTRFAFACGDATAIRVITPNGMESIPLAGTLGELVWLGEGHTILSSARSGDTILLSVHEPSGGGWIEKRLFEGTRLAATLDWSYERIAIATGPTEITIHHFATGATEAITAPLEIGHLYWSPAGDRVAVMGDGMVVIDERGDIIHDLRMRGTTERVVWSDDGRFCAVAFEHQLHVLHPDGVMATVNVEAGRLSWTPDNWLLHTKGPTVYTNPAAIQVEISAIRPDGGEIIRYDGGLLGFWVAFPKEAE